MDRTTPWRSLLNTIVITRLGMCKTKAHHCVPLWTRTLSHVWALLASVLSQLFAFLWRMSKFGICIEHSAASTMSHQTCVQVQRCHYTPPHPTQPHVWRSIKHACKFNDVITPHPTPPNPTCDVASNMRASSTMSLHPTPPHPTPRVT